MFLSKLDVYVIKFCEIIIFVKFIFIERRRNFKIYFFGNCFFEKKWWNINVFILMEIIYGLC